MEVKAAIAPYVFKAQTFMRDFSALFVPEVKNISENIYRYGINDQLPNKLIEYINNSGVAKRCVNKVASYIQADGFNKEVKDFPVNEKQTADSILSPVAYDLAYFKGFALNVGRDSSGKIATVKHIPFQWIRKTLDGDFQVNQKRGTKDYRSNENTYYPKFAGTQITSTQLIEQIKKFKNVGEILYAYVPTPDNPQYPVPDYYAAIEDILTSTEIQRYDLEAVMNGFVPSAILTFIGKADNTTKDQHGYTARDYRRMALEDFTGHSKNESGLSGRNRLLVTEVETAEQVPKLDSFDAKAILDSSNTKRDVVERAVCRWFGVHPVLVGYSDASILGNTQSIANASLELANNVNALQRLIERTFKACFPEQEWKLSQFKPVNYVPDSVLSKLTDDEIRALFGYAPLPTDKNSDQKLLAEKLGVGGTQSLTAIISDPVLSEESKRAALELLFGLSPEDAKKLVPQIDKP